MAVRAGVKYASVVPLRSEVLSARKAGISYSRTDGKFALMLERVLYLFRQLPGWMLDKAFFSGQKGPTWA